jgi:hypothetical protein
VSRLCCGWCGAEITGKPVSYLRPPDKRGVAIVLHGECGRHIFLIHNSVAIETDRNAKAKRPLRMYDADRDTWH